MVILDYIRVLFLLIICSAASISDLKNGKISNRLMGYSLSAGVLINLITYGLLDRNHIKIFLCNATVLILLAILLYAAHIWAGGDSKLLIVIAFLYPVGLYWNHAAEINLFFIVVFMFISGFVYLICESIWLGIKHRNHISCRRILKKMAASVVYYVKTLLFIGAICHVYVAVFMSRFELPQTVFSLLCLFLILLLQYTRLLESKAVLVAVIIFDLGMTLVTGNITINTNWITYAIVIAFMALRTFMSEFNYQTIATNSVRKGMVFSRATTALFSKSKVEGLPPLSDESLKSRITDSQAESVKRWEKSKYGCDTVVIVRKIPFAIFMLCGVTVYYILKEVLY